MDMNQNHMPHKAKGRKRFRWSAVDTMLLLLVLLVETSHKTSLESRRKGNRLQVLKRGAAFNSETGGIIGDHL